MANYKSRQLMSVDDWDSQFKNCPKQRDTEFHLASAIGMHLSESADVQASVAGAILKNGAKYKVDGHTRTLAWQTDVLERPKKVRVDLYECTDMDDLFSLYDSFDSTHSVKGPSSEVQSVYTLCKLHPKSRVFRSGAGMHLTLRLAEGMAAGMSTGQAPSLFDLYQSVLEFKKAIKWVDSVNFRPVDLPIGYRAAALLIAHRDGEKCLDFLREVRNKNGYTYGIERDPIATVFSYPKSARAARVKRDEKGPVVRRMLASVMLNSYKNWLDDPEFTTTVYPTKSNIIGSFHPFNA